MRIGCVYAPRREWPKWQWVCAALSQIGHDVVAVNDVQQMERANDECDLLLFEHRDCGVGRRHVLNLAPKKRCQWAQWWFDLFQMEQSLPIAETNNWRHLGEVMQCFDRVFVKERSRVEEYRSLGVRAEYMDQGCPSPWRMIQLDEHPKYDVIVFGSVDPQWYRQRIRVASELVAAGMRVGWASQTGTVPNGVERLPWCHPKDLPWLMSNAYGVLCVDADPVVDGYWSDRHWLVRGAGATPITLNDPVANVELLKSLPVEDRVVCAAMIRNTVMEAHTYEHRASAIIDSLRGRCEGLPRLQGQENRQVFHEGAPVN
jgi:hypothetical protein